MNHSLTLSACRVVALLLLSVAVAAPAAAADKLPQTTKEGLELVKQTKTRVVYMAPGTDLSQYTKVFINDAYIAFKKNWKRDYNRDEGAMLEMRVNDRDMDRIKKQLAADFKTVFTKEVEKSGHELSNVTGSDVLILRPAIINLDVTSVDTKSAGMNRSYTANPGSMTLYLEILDSVTNALIVRVEDAEALDNGGVFQVANSVTNSSEAKRVLRAWADELVGHLGSVTEPSASSGSD